jgi:hypothetical protein
MPGMTSCSPWPSASFSFSPFPPSRTLFCPLPNADASEVFSEMNLLVFTTEIENSTMNSTSSRVSTSA